MGVFKKKEERTCVNMEQMAETFANVYFVKLLFKEQVEIEEVALQEVLVKQFQTLDVVMQTDVMRGFALKDHTVTYQEGVLPSQLCVLDVIPFDPSTISSMALSQCWGLNQPEQLLQECHYELMIHDFMASGLDRVERCTLLAQFVETMLELFPQCIALYWPHAQKFQSRQQFTESSWREETLHFLDGGLSIRFFNIQDSEDMVVDSVGLQAIGISDIQCHYHDLDPNHVVNFVGNLACYLFKEGDVIQDGETVDGFAPAQARWICRHEDALIAPQRVVLDIDMLEYAAGKRDRS